MPTIDEYLHGDSPAESFARWRKYGGAELEPLFAHTTIIRAKWLIALAEGTVMPERRGVVPAWQQVPPDAVSTLEELQYSSAYLSGHLPIAVLSYGWLPRRILTPAEHYYSASSQRSAC